MTVFLGNSAFGHKNGKKIAIAILVASGVGLLFYENFSAMLLYQYSGFFLTPIKLVGVLLSVIAYDLWKSG